MLIFLFFLLYIRHHFLCQIIFILFFLPFKSCKFSFSWTNSMGSLSCSLNTLFLRFVMFMFHVHVLLLTLLFSCVFYESSFDLFWVFRCFIFIWSIYEVSLAWLASSFREKKSMGLRPSIYFWSTAKKNCQMVIVSSYMMKVKEAKLNMV